MGNLQLGCPLPYCRDELQCHCAPLVKGSKRSVLCNAACPALGYDCGCVSAMPKSDCSVGGVAGTAGFPPTASVEQPVQHVMVGLHSESSQTDISLDTKQEYHPPMLKRNGGPLRHLCDYCHPKADAIGVELPDLAVMATGRCYHATDCPQVKSVKEKCLPGFDKMRKLSDCAQCRHIVLHRMHYPGRSVQG